jgi:predicted small lipoprotein YifL
LFPEMKRFFVMQGIPRFSRRAAVSPDAAALARPCVITSAMAIFFACGFFGCGKKNALSLPPAANAAHTTKQAEMSVRSHLASNTATAAEFSSTRTFSIPTQPLAMSEAAAKDMSANPQLDAVVSGVSAENERPPSAPFFAALANTATQNTAPAAASRQVFLQDSLAAYATAARDAEERERILAGLGEFSETEQMEALVQFSATERNTECLTQILAALDGISNQDAAKLTVIGNALRVVRSPTVRQAAADALESLDSPQAVPFWQTLLAAPDKNLHQQAADAIERIHSQLPAAAQP